MTDLFRARKISPLHLVTDEELPQQKVKEAVSDFDGRWVSPGSTYAQIRGFWVRPLLLSDGLAEMVFEIEKVGNSSELDWAINLESSY